MAELTILKGPGAGQFVRLGLTPVVIGRNRDCEIVIPSSYLSRKHTRIEWREGAYFLLDLGTTNGTHVNGRRLEAPHALEDNDQIRIGDTLLMFRESEPAREEMEPARLLFQSLNEGTEEGGERMQFQLSLGGPIEEECRRLREALEINHVFLVRTETSPLDQQLHLADSPALQLLGKGFHRVVVLDAAAGLDEQESFDLEQFLRHVYERMVQIFGLRASLGTFHVENVSQILKDEPRSLLCLLNVQLIPITDLRRLRGFTQEVHQVLFLCQGERDLAREEAEVPDYGSESSVLDLTVSTAALKSGALDLFNRCLRWHQCADPNSLGGMIAEDLFQLFSQADRCFVLLGEDGANPSLPRVVRTRRPHEEANARPSRLLVRKCLETAQAFLSDDASRDERIQRGQTVADFRVRSVMCVPLCTPEGTAFGVIQLDTEDRSKRFTQGELKLLRDLANYAAVAMESARLREESLARERIHRDLELARHVQQSFLPSHLPDVAGYDFFAYYKPFQMVGGDYYDFIPLPQGRLAVAVADVSGKGIPAALLMARLSCEVRSCLLAESDLARAIGKLNEQVYRFAGSIDRFGTLAALVLNPQDHVAVLVNAGFPSPQLWRGGSATLSDAIPASSAGLPLGLIEDFAYESCEIALDPGDNLILYTDGIPDALDVQNATFSLESVQRVIQEAGAVSATTMGQRLVQAVERHTVNQNRQDDIALVCLGRTT